MVDDLRVFVAGVDGVTLLTPAPGVEDAYDIMVAGGVDPRKAADLAVGFARGGYDPVFHAKKFLRLSQYVQTLPSSRA